MSQQEIRQKYYDKKPMTILQVQEDMGMILSQIEQGIEQISGVTQNTAASSQESSAISEQLEQRARELDKLINNFKLYRPVSR